VRIHHRFVQIAVSDHETGAARIHAAMLAALARVLRSSTDEILGLSSARTARTTLAPYCRFLRRSCGAIYER
jgi:hypothetical protein